MKRPIVQDHKEQGGVNLIFDMEDGSGFVFFLDDDSVSELHGNLGEVLGTRKEQGGE